MEGTKKKVQKRNDFIANDAETVRVTEVFPMNSGTRLRVCGMRKPTIPCDHNTRDSLAEWYRSVFNHRFRNTGDGSGCCLQATANVVRDPCFATADANVFLEAKTWTGSRFLVK